MTRVPIYIRTREIATGLPPERTYEAAPHGDCVLFGVAEVPPGWAAWYTADQIAKHAVNGFNGARWIARDFALPEDAARKALGCE